MNHKNSRKILIGLAVLLIVSLACGPRPTEVPATSAPIQASTSEVEQLPQPSQPSQPSQPADSDNLTRAQKSQLAHATVRIWGMQNQGGQLQTIYHGSGTVLTPDGMILTNCHVVDPISMGYPNEYRPDALLVEIVASEDKPPVPSYYAKIMASDPVLDLAVIRLDTTLDGKTVNTSKVKLPWVQLGDSDKVSFGDRIFIFGFPGIGGETITYSTGDVSGFDSENPVGDRAWIKTDATIAGGNSGGLASNSKGEIIGIPSQIGTGTASSPTDCRRIQDTNGDGTIDENDACIPTGGFINGIRPVNWARDLIQAARSGMAYASPYPNPLDQEPETNPNPPQNQGGAKFVLKGWAGSTDNQNCPVNPVQNFPTGTKVIYASLGYQGFQGGENLSLRWLMDSREVATNSLTWPTNPTNCYSFSLQNGDDALPDGDYTLEVYLQNTMLLQTQTTIGGVVANNPQNQSGGVTLKGQITDANTGRGIANILVVVLKPGVDPETWMNSGEDGDILTHTTTDVNGNYQLPDLLPRGQSYGVLAGKKNSGYQTAYGYVDITQEDSEIVNLPIQLSK